ncbi:MAG: 7-carboxy-7-deazaguanine synthase [Candidatus Marinimicrobia bacterium]|jgi:7-carboxy-7-deazaguanine synthase (Cx14CxxC type)|nr:7-carboxy-7-deazaguanine synthase [Candidatus Neomarinimicrobiota bacterium]MDP6615261.1 7-carboxy-7-deazaguanine synthase [Candidatus Neomarinimicrobiota bacterium]MDP6820962.1 7-carboxy-7-deazaguanine synthase [Candidatus Neomarinimicrobiota bacterium]MDP6861287.1 7-carboxy-7-deazaguanine synthase [Candidatus Neomarinimicrobiota bacterium]MDP7272075.1 7-carboxy-7-deazaguanine synthase [Candidatus Neomarinimicrobiota bacterium]|tara:strand:- start:220 stop:846 length:627 start_codon:yes stop_codon:yes gene_type:complete
MYTIKEIYFTQQGEGYHTGRPAVFLRFTGCNLWTGFEIDRESAICYWCDTDFVGMDGPYGGKYSAAQIADTVQRMWPENEKKPYLVCTGGEPLLQMDDEFISTVHRSDFEIGIETNGTKIPPEGIDWICVSPKANAEFILKKGHELKIVFPQSGINPRQYQDLDFDHFFIQPMDGPNQGENIEKSKEFVVKNPKWKLSLQTHKILGIP